MKNLHFLLFLLIIALSPSYAFSQSGGIEGLVSDSNGVGLGYATIYIRNIETGTTTNDEGEFNFKLPPGKYDIVFQYLGYETKVIFVELTNEMKYLNVKLNSISYRLREVVVDADKEDPAYTIMRKAIAKSNYHRQQLDWYSARVYIKGSGRLLDSPFFLRKRIAKEGIDSSTAFTSESVIDFEYTRPNTYKQHVISVRTSGDDSNTSPNEYVFGSFYEPEINEAISPLSPKALAYYHFKYLGSFTDRGYTINMIKVIPKSKGDNLFAGDLFITDDLWSIYSLDMTTMTYGIEVNVKVIFSPINDLVWMPINSQFDIDASIMGFDVVFNYLAVVSDYKIKINEDLDHSFEVVDEKIESERAELIEKKTGEKSNPLEAFNTEEELTRKQLKEIIKEYEKQEMAEMSSQNITLVTEKSIDSLASKKDSTYWSTIRPVPLNSFEKRGYQKLDSIAVVQKEKEQKDSLKEHGGFKWFDAFLGGGFDIGENQHLSIVSMLEQINFNTVDGLYMGYKLKYSIYTENDNRIRFTPRVRYAFSRKAWTGDLKSSYTFGKNLRSGKLYVNGGRFTRQLNNEEPINEYINAFTTLFLNRNYMKIYEQNYLDVGIEKRISDKFSFSFNSEFAERRSLENNSDFTFINWDSREYSSNDPDNIELADTDFPVHQSWINKLQVNYRPWLKFTMRNGVKREMNSSTPRFSFIYTKAIHTDFSDIDFDRIEVAYKHRLKIGAGSRLSLNVKLGSTINDSKMTFIDYKHFMGNRTPFETNDPVASYRLLPYYDYSTTREYLVAHAHYSFRKFLLTQFTLVRFAGLTENIFVNYLGTHNSGNYTEIGYGLDNIFRIFRIEGILSFQDGKYIDSGLRIGISTVLDFD